MRAFIVSFFAIMAFSLLLNDDPRRQELKTGINDVAVPGYP